MQEVWLVLDTSGSMKSGALEEPLKKGLGQLYESLGAMAALDGSNIVTRTMHWSEQAEWVSREVLPAKGAGPRPFHSRGLTKAEPMLDLLAREVSGAQRGLGYAPPFIVLVTDGMPVDDYKSALTKFNAATWSDLTPLASIALGPDASLGFCRGFMGGSGYEPIICTNPEALDAGIHQVTKVCEALLRRAKGQRAPLPMTRSFDLPALVLTPTADTGARHVSPLYASSADSGTGLSTSLLMQFKGERPKDLAPVNAALREALIAGERVLRANLHEEAPRLAGSVLASISQVAGGETSLLAMAVSHPSATSLVSVPEALTGSFRESDAPDSPRCSKSEEGWVVETYPKGSKSLVASTPEFTGSLGHGQDADKLAADLANAYRERGEEFVKVSSEGWVKRAHAESGKPAWMLAALFAW